MTALLRALESAGTVEELHGATRSGTPLPLVTPSSEGELIDLVQRAARDELCLLPLGRGSKLPQTQLAVDVDFAVSTRALAGIVAHEPDDGTITAQAGTPYGELFDRARSGGHHLSPEIPRANESTLGGVVAAGQSGVERLRFGPLRNQLLGTRALMADGTVTRSGGRLVKNVTGFDLHRLYCGSQGSLCILLEASLRLHPAPETVQHIVLDVSDVAAALRRVRELSGTPVAPWLLAIDADAPTGPAHLHLELAGREAVVAHELDALPDVWRSASLAEGATAGDEHRHYADGEGDPRRSAVIRVTTLPSRFDAVWDSCARNLGQHSPLRFLRLQPQLAALELQLDPAHPREVAELATSLRRVLIGTGARVALGGDAALRRLVDCHDPVGPALAWMQQLRQRFDPRGLFAAGRGPGGL